MTNFPLLTIVLLTYNHEDSIKRALESVINQKTKYKYEIWIAEDCSTDNTLSICTYYAEKHPSKIKIFAQATNTNSKHLTEVLGMVKSEYFTVLEGDDYWTDKNKIQTALDVLEKNSKYVTFAHDTLYDDTTQGTKKSLVHDIHNTTIKNPVEFDDAPYLHTSSRIHRNVINIRKHFKNLDHTGDIHLYYSYLDRGPIYYYDKVMSVYNINGKGMWSQLTEQQQVASMEISNYECNALLGFRRDEFFSQKAARPRLLKIIKRFFGIKPGWKIYAKLVSIK